MKIAYVVSDLSYPAAEGLHQQTLLTMKSFMEHGHQVELFGIVKSKESLDEDRMYSETGIRFCSPPVVDPSATLLHALRIIAGRRYELKSLTSVEKGMTEKNYDVIHWEGMAAVSLAFRMKEHLPSVLSIIDPPSRRNLRLVKSAPGGAKLKHLGSAVVGFVLERLVAKVGVVHVVSREDRLWLNRMHKKMKAIDIPVVLPSMLELHAQAPSKTRQSASYYRVLIYGDLRQSHMRQAFDQFVDTVLPQSEEANNCQFIVMGRVAATSQLRDRTSKWSFEFIEWSTDYIHEIATADIVILLDTVGTGLKNRAIQSLALGATVIGTDVSFEGIPVEQNVHALVVAEWCDFAPEIDRLLRDPDLRGRLSSRGTALSRNLFGREAVYSKWQSLHKSVCSGFKDSSS